MAKRWIFGLWIGYVVGQDRLIRILEDTYGWNLLRTLCVMSTGVDKQCTSIMTLLA